MMVRVVAARSACSLLAVMALTACQAADAPSAAEEPPAAVAPAPRPTATEQFLEANGTKLFVKRMGSGSPVVVVHGGPVLEHGYLLPHLEALAADHELIFYDQRLSGRSAGSAPRASIRLATFVDDLEAIRVALGLGQIHVLAHSWGGLIAQRYAIRYGANLRSLVLLDSMPASTELWRAEQVAVAEATTAAAREEMEALRASEAFAERRPEAIAAMLGLSFRPQFVDPAAADRLVLYVPDDYSGRSAQFGAMMVDLESYDQHAELGAVQVPTLVLYGSAEPGAEIGGKALAAALPNVRFVLIENAGHFPFIENPDDFLAAVTAFLE